jgi:hypothetical protein
MLFGVDDNREICRSISAAGRGRLRAGWAASASEHSWRMACARGPEGIIVSLAERIG